MLAARAYPLAGDIIRVNSSNDIDSHNYSINEGALLPKPGYDLGTMRGAALAYRREHQAGRLDEPAHEAAGPSSS
jgi:hypothetical protein